MRNLRGIEVREIIQSKDLYELAGIILIAGVLALVYQGFSYTKRSKTRSLAPLRFNMRKA